MRGAAEGSAAWRSRTTQIASLVRGSVLISSGSPKGQSTPIFASWGLGGFQRGRSETELVLTYQF